MAYLRHKRDANARRTVRPSFVAAPIALVATAAAVVLGVALQDSPSTGDNANTGAVVADLASTPSETPTPSAPTGRPEVLSRSAARDLGPLVRPTKTPNLMSEVETRRAIRKADTKLWTTEELNLWTRPGENADEAGELEPAKQVLVTGRELWGRVEVVVGGRSQWVTSGYLSEDEPVGAGAGLSMEPCPDSDVESGLTDSAVYVYRSVCNAFPEITTYGGYAPRGSEHSTGKAIDIMVSDVGLGTAIAEFLRANSAELNLYNVIWRQEIFTPERGGEGWRYMASRGSTTANHYDHVHVSTY